jgi:hypothetical protein
VFATTQCRCRAPIGLPPHNTLCSAPLPKPYTPSLVLPLSPPSTLLDVLQEGRLLSSATGAINMVRGREGGGVLRLLLALLLGRQQLGRWSAAARELLDMIHKQTMCCKQCAVLGCCELLDVQHSCHVLAFSMGQLSLCCILAGVQCQPPCACIN